MTNKVSIKVHLTSTFQVTLSLDAASPPGHESAEASVASSARSAAAASDAVALQAFRAPGSPAYKYGSQDANL